MGVFFLLIAFVVSYGVYIIPKLLIKVPGHIPVLFGRCLKLRLFHQIWLLAPLFITKLLQTYKKLMESSLKMLFLHISTFRISNKSICSALAGHQKQFCFAFWNWWVQNNWYLKARSKNFSGVVIGIFGQSLFENLKTSKSYRIKHKFENVSILSD